ncbi:hypothetical protein EDD21DRAFT_352611 [Dissophora ornata]|nr:hypothetical protein EDD21DRAFT_352611 [Dissophora ornata]
MPDLQGFEVREALASLTLSPSDSLKTIVRSSRDSLRWMLASGLAVYSWFKLSRLEFTGDNLDKWILNLERIFERSSIPTLRKLRVIDTSTEAQTLSHGSARWIISTTEKDHFRPCPQIDIPGRDPPDWNKLVSSIDLSVIEALDLSDPMALHIHIEALLNNLDEDALIETSATQYGLVTFSKPPSGKSICSLYRRKWVSFLILCTLCAVDIV